jgi:hypothetical protein
MDTQCIKDNTCHKIQINFQTLNFLNMGSNISYTDSDIVVLMIKLLVGGTDNSSVLGTFNYIEDL